VSEGRRDLVPFLHRRRRTTIVVESGNDRFAIHFEFEKLPPAPLTPPLPLLLLKPPAANPTYEWILMFCLNMRDGSCYTENDAYRR
jgi:hypothetical protein